MSPDALVVTDGVAIDVALPAVRPAETSTGLVVSTPENAATDATPPTAALAVHVKEVSPAASTWRKTASAPVAPWLVRVTSVHPAGAVRPGWDLAWLFPKPSDATSMSPARA